MSGQKKECPSCAMEIERNEEICPICGYEFPPRALRNRMTFAALIFLLIIIISYLFIMI